MQFEWDETKNRSNLEKHGLSFNYAIQIFERSHFEYPSDRLNEKRVVAVGKADQVYLAVVYTQRGNIYRIISARIARDKERNLYEKYCKEND